MVDKFDLCVIGGGSAGLTVTAGAANLGVRTVLIDRDQLGGDCLNRGCVPSKALLAAAHSAQMATDARRFGITVGQVQIDYAAAMDHVARTIEAIRPMDSAARYRAFGAEVIAGEARFVGPDDIAVGDRRIRAKYVVIATGSRPAVPSLPGLDRTPYFTTDTIWSNRIRPDHLLIIGAGPVGLELAQAHRRLGARVTVIEALRAMGDGDPEMIAILLGRLRAEGITIREQTRVTATDARDGGVALTLEGGEIVTGSHLLVAIGRKPSVDSLALETAGIAATSSGITVDAHLRTSRTRIYAIGDVIAGLHYTHAASHQAGIVLRHMLFKLPVKYDPLAVPRTLYTDPGFAAVGLDEAAARARHGAIRIFRAGFGDNDLARAEGDDAGHVKIIADRRGRLLGVGIVGARAGEMIQLPLLALGRKLGVGALAGLALPYPTRGETLKRAASQFFAPKLFSPKVRALVRFLLTWA